MSTAEPAREKLCQAIDSLRTDIDRVEFWADTLDRLSQPSPSIPPTTSRWCRILRDLSEACVSRYAPPVSAADCRMVSSASAAL